MRSVSNASCKGKSFKIHIIKMVNQLRYVKLLPLQGDRFANIKNPGRCPGLRASAPSGRAAMGLLGIRACCHGLQGVLLWASGLQGELLWTSRRAAVGFLQPFRSPLSMRSHTANRSSAAGVDL